MRRMLLAGSETRYRFTEAELGAEGLRLCRDAGDGLPDVVLLDFSLPDMNAADLLAELCQGADLPPFPVVVITGKDKRSGPELLRAGAQDFLGKSWTTAESLTRAVENAIERFALLTARKRAEEQLRAGEERLALGMEVAGFAIAEVDYMTGLIHLGAQAARLFGLGAAAMAVPRPTVHANCHPEDREELARRIAACLDPAGSGWFAMDHRVMWPGGEVRWLSVRKKIFFTGEGAARRPRRAMLAALDVTAEKTATEAVRAAKEAAESANTTKDRFLATLSHELRTPLTPVLMTLEKLELDPKLPAGLREDVAMMKLNIELEAKLIDDLLDLNRIISGKPALTIAPVDLNATIRNACELCGPCLRERGLSLETDLDAATGLVAADAARLQQVLWNILSNAIKFTPKEGVIRVLAQRLDNGRCEVRVRDSGKGIPPGMLTCIFNAFDRGGAAVTRQFGGLGLGLAICKALVELHRGSIRAESGGAGKGATFIIELPGAAAPVKATDAVSPTAGARESR